MRQMNREHEIKVRAVLAGLSPLILEEPTPEEARNGWTAETLRRHREEMREAEVDRIFSHLRQPPNRQPRWNVWRGLPK